MWTSQYGNERKGVNPQESCLTPATAPNMALQFELPLPANAASCTTNQTASSCCSGQGGSYNPMYTQPLYMNGATVKSGSSNITANIIIATTLSDQVFAYDATATQTTFHCSSSSTPVGKYYWAKNLITDLGDCGGISSGEPIQNPGTALPQAGVLSTPVISLANQIVYVVGGCQTTEAPFVNHWYLHGLNLLDGSDAFTAVDVGASTYVTSYGGAAAAVNTCGSGGTTACLGFNASYQLQRAALTLTSTNTQSGTPEIYVAFGVNAGSENNWTGTDANNPYHGWLFGYALSSAGLITGSNTQANFAFASTANYGGTADTTTPCTDTYGSGGSGETETGHTENNCGLSGGIWQSGRGPAIYTDPSTYDNYVIVGVGNGGFETASTYATYGSSVVGFAVSKTCNTTPAGVTSCGPPLGSFTSNCYGNSTTCPPTGTPPTPNYRTQNAFDQDMGMPGGMIVGSDGGTGDSTHLLTCDKSGQCYVLASNPSSLSGYQYPDCSGCEFAGSQTALSYPGYLQCYGNTNPPTGYVACDSISTMIYYYGYLFLWPYGEDVDWCYWDSGTFSCNPHHVNDPTDDLVPSGFPGGSLTLTLYQPGSPSGTVLTGSGVLWAVLNPTVAGPYIDPGSDPGDFGATIRAYGLTMAPPISGNPDFEVTTLWTSSEAFMGSIFALPTVANGYLYVPAYGTASSTGYGSCVLVYYPNNS